MTKAQKIMKKKALIRAEMDKQLTKKQSAYLWRKATRKLDDILKKYESLPKGVHTHTDSFISVGKTPASISGGQPISCSSQWRVTIPH